MSEFDDDPVGAAFAAFRAQRAAAPQPAGMTAVRTVVRRRVRAGAVAVLTVLAIAAPTAWYAYLSGRHGPTPGHGPSSWHRTRRPPSLSAPVPPTTWST